MSALGQTEKTQYEQMSSGLPPENGHDQQIRHDRYADTGPDVTGEIEQPGAVGPLLGRKGCEGDGQRDNHHTAEAEPGRIMRSFRRREGP